MVADGRYQPAAKALDSTRDRFPSSRSLSELERRVFFDLAPEKYQGFSPFKDIVYTRANGRRGFCRGAEPMNRCQEAGPLPRLGGEGGSAEASALSSPAARPAGTPRTRAPAAAGTS